MAYRIWDRRTREPAAPRRVWRMSAQCPQGEFIQQSPGATVAPALSSGSAGSWWNESSRELRAGLEVFEFEMRSGQQR